MMVDLRCDCVRVCRHTDLSAHVSADDGNFAVRLCPNIRMHRNTDVSAIVSADDSDRAVQLKVFSNADTTMEDHGRCATAWC